MKLYKVSKGFVGYQLIILVTSQNWMKKTKFYRKIFFFQTRLPVPATRPQSSINQRKEFVEQNESKNEKKDENCSRDILQKGKAQYSWPPH